MGDDSANESDFDSWVDYVCQHIDDAAGFPVAVDIRLPRDVQTDAISGGTHDQLVAMAEAKRELWLRWCADDSV